MKRLFIFLLSLSLLLCGCGRGELPDTPTKAPAAPTEFIPEGQEAVTEPTAGTTTVRVLTRLSSLDENGQESWYRTYEYDAQGRLLLEREVASTGEESYRAEYAYGEHAHTITYTYMDGTTEQVTRTLDSQGRLLHQQTAAPGEMPYALLKYTYDQYGNQLTCQQSLDGEESIQSFTYTYSQDGKVLGEKETMDGELVGQREYFYDEQGRIAEILHTDASGLRYSTIYTWEGNTETATTLNPDDTVALINIRTYDDWGNLLRDEVQQDGSVINCAEYTYEDLEIPEN